MGNLGVDLTIPIYDDLRSAHEGILVLAVEATNFLISSAGATQTLPET